MVDPVERLSDLPQVKLQLAGLSDRVIVTAAKHVRRRLNEFAGLICPWVSNGDLDMLKLQLYAVHNLELSARVGRKVLQLGMDVHNLHPRLPLHHLPSDDAARVREVLSQLHDELACLDTVSRLS